MTSLTLIDVGSIENALSSAPSEKYRAAIAFPDGTVVLGETLTDLVEELLGEELADSSTVEGARLALDQRYDFALDVVNARQALLAAVAAEHLEFDIEVEDEETLTSLFSPRDQPVPTVETWGHQVPLVLIATDYAPYTAEPQPGGNVEWLDPATDLTLLQSLAAFGDFELLLRD